MADYKFDAKDLGSYEVLKEGEYEAIAEKLQIQTLPSGKEKVSIMFRIREDVEQEGKNRVIFEDIWKEKDNPQYFNRKRLNQLLGTQHLEDGTSFTTIQDLLDQLKGAYVRIKVAVEFSEYRNENQNKISYYKTTTKPAQKVGEEIKDEDLPF
jgi:hypothetical protein